MASAHGAAAPAGEAIEYRLVVSALFAGCLPAATARWLGGARGNPVAAALASARDIAAHAYSLPG